METKLRYLFIFYIGPHVNILIMYNGSDSLSHRNFRIKIKQVYSTINSVHRSAVSWKFNSAKWDQESETAALTPHNSKVQLFTCPEGRDLIYW